MFRIAIAGGIGSGKSAVTAILRDLGAKVVVADEINAELLTDPNYIARIKDIFPSVVHNNVINKKELGQIVYHNEGKRRQLMSLAHPEIFRRMFALYPNASPVFYEIPLLSETDVAFDLIWYLDSDVEDRVRPIVNRDGVDVSYARRIISLQGNEDSIRRRADVVIRNDGGLDVLRERVRDLYCSILRQFS